jgi:hypothetical protein
MSKTATTAIKPDTFLESATKPDATELRRQEIVAYVEDRLGPDLAGLYSEAIRSSVSTGCHDLPWSAGDFRRVDAYVDILQRDWLSKQGDVTQILVKVQHLLAFGTDAQKEQLKTLLELP